MIHLYDQAALAAKSSISVLVFGETGVGKEVLVRSIRSRSSRAQRTFLNLNCAAMSETLLEGELFGHERGAFSGAHQARAGVFEAVDGGTVFLDEVGELSIRAQAKLLRVLEEGKVMRLGSRTETSVDVRIISATNRNLKDDVQQGLFRQDLLFRLSGIELFVPPLRDRTCEIEPLAYHFLERILKNSAAPLRPEISAEALQALLKYSWPGNVRELRNAMERAFVLSSGSKITSLHLPPDVVGGSGYFRAVSDKEDKSHPLQNSPGLYSINTVATERTLREEVRAEASLIEQARISQALMECGGNQTRTAQVLGISRRTLVNRLAKYKFKRPRARDDS